MAKATAAISSGVEITLEKYGLITQTGNNDPVAAQLHLKVSVPNKNPIFLRYPEDFAKQEYLTVSTRPLETIKQDATEIDALFTTAATWLANQAANKL